MVRDDSEQKYVPRGASDSTRLRYKNSCNSRSAVLSVAARKTCWMRGMNCSACHPNTAGLVGTSRHPRKFRPASWAHASIRCRASSSDPSWRKIMPTANRSGNSTPFSSASCRKNSSGIAVINPAPSPLVPSASTAPR